MSAPFQARQFALITLAAAAALLAFHFLPSGSRLTHMDFLADKAAVLQFCDPQNSRPLTAATDRQPVTMTLDPGHPGATVEAAFTLTTISGKPIAPQDLLPAGHPEVKVRIRPATGGEEQSTTAHPAKTPGQWNFTFTPAGPPPFHITAQFTPIASPKEMAVESDLR